MKYLLISLILFGGYLFPERGECQEILGNHYYTFSTSVPVTQVVFTPSANTAGAVLKTAVLFAGCNSSAGVTLLAVNATSSVAIFALNVAPGNATTGNLTHSIYLPAGTGLSINQQNTGCGTAAVSFDFLN
jgi:hypothetical protein